MTARAATVARSSCSHEVVPLLPPLRPESTVLLPSSIMPEGMPSKITTVISIGTGKVVDTRGMTVGASMSEDPVDALMGLGAALGSEVAEAAQTLWRSSAIQSEADAEQFEAIHAPHLKWYVRLQPTLTTDLKLDETNLTAIHVAREETREWMQSPHGDAELRRAADALLAQEGAAVLSLDGGGMRGFIQLEVVKELTKRIGRPLTDVTMLMCGTSIGGAAVAVLALGGARAIIKAERVLYKLRDLLAAGKPYDIDRVVKEDLLLVLDIDLMTTLPTPTRGDGSAGSAMPFLFLLSTKIAESGRPLPTLLTNYAVANKLPTLHWPVWQLVKLTSAAPGTFQAVCIGGDVYQDGALVANNPVLHGFNEAQRLLRL